MAIYFYLMCFMYDGVSCYVWIALAIVFECVSVAARLGLAVSLAGYSMGSFLMESWDVPV